MTEQTITVTGSGNIHILPDVTRLEIFIQSIFDTYETAYQMGEDNTHDIAGVMKACGLSTLLPKTTRFDIDKAYHSEYIDGEYTGKQIFDGYRLSQRLKIDLGMDNVLLAKVVRTLGETVTDMEITIGYTVKDPRPHQLKMLERAVKDAKEKAAIMAAAAGCTLGDVKTIDYSEHELHIYSEARNIDNCAEASCCNEASLDITPDDLCGGENVTVTWLITK